MPAWKAWIGQELPVDVVPDERWTTVSAAPGQPGLLDGTAAFRVDPDGREADLLGVAPGMSSAVPRADLRRLDSAIAFATIHPLPACNSQNTGENLLAVLHQNLRPRTLATTNIVGRT